MKKNVLFLSVLGLVAGLSVEAKEPPMSTSGKTTSNKSMKVMEELCAPATAQSDLSINNVRATILGGGDMWWDLNNARYEVPKGSNKHAMFAGALWLGGVDEGNQLKLAAMTYRQRGSDYWPGPLTTDGTASVDKSVCDKYDRHFFMNREDVELHRAWLLCKEDPDCNEAAEFPGYENSIPQTILEWPGNGIDGELPYNLAPYIDRDQNGIYDPLYDYPGYDLDRAFDCRVKDVDILYGDQTIWWVYNDRGNVHTETQAGALGFEIRAQAFAFSTNDEINNMTFNNYRIINRSTFRLTNTYFGTWFDPDLGNYNDDIIGSDISRGLGYCYNADTDDEGPLGYGKNPPAVGFDFFQGPFADYFDGRDNDRDGCPDGVRDASGNCVPEDPATGVNERIIMSGFMYYNNSGSQGVVAQTTDPDNAAEFYNYLQSRWKNGNNLVIENPSGLGQQANGDGYTADGTGTKTLFAYPGLSYDTTQVTEPINPLPNGGWYESPGNRADKRGLHCAGPFSLAPGALNFITTGVIWARDFVRDDIFASVEQVIIADDRAQKLFDNCFQVLNGPTAPDMDIQELDRALVITLTNDPNSSNNAKLGYREYDPIIPAHVGNFATTADSIRYYNYIFEGYQIFQLRNSSVGVTEIYDPTQARLVAQVDVQNNITKLINYEKDQSMGVSVPQDMTLSESNSGIRHSFLIQEDAFASGDRRLVNHKEYYYLVIAYGANQYDLSSNAPVGSFQSTPYLAGRLNIEVKRAIPHIPTPEAGGTVQNSTYGDGPPITRIEGLGNGGSFTELTPETKLQIVQNFSVDNPVYMGGMGPIEVKVVDPLNVPRGIYTVSFTGANNLAKWTLTDALGNVVANSDTTIAFYNEQFIPELGVSITIQNVPSPGGDEEGTRDNGVIGGTISFEDPTKAWLIGVPDGSGYNPYNWILAGGNNVPSGEPASTYEDFSGDPLAFYTRILNGTWAPFAFTSPISLGNGANSPGLGPGSTIRPSIADIHGVDVVFTSDRSMWTRVPVLEMQEDPGLSIGNARKLTLRQSPGYDLVGGQLVQNPNLIGWSYFPGYAIDVETGKRLNMAFGENSWLVGQRGTDMLWNPTSTFEVVPGNPVNDGIVWGGQHVVYVMNSTSLVQGQETDITYKGDDPNLHPLKTHIDNLNSTSASAANLARVNFFRGMMWTSIAMMAPGYGDVDATENMPTDAVVRLRMDRPYERFITDNSNSGNPRYQFNLNSLATTTMDMSTATSALDLIRVVPNPYYAASAYEDSQLDNIVKITNLPVTCNITIFTTSGTVVRKIRKDNSDTYVEWDLKNDYNVPISSGVYLIHIDAGQIGEKVVKWFGAMRPVDLNAF